MDFSKIKIFENALSVSVKELENNLNFTYIFKIICYLSTFISRWSLWKTHEKGNIYANF